MSSDFSATFNEVDEFLQSKGVTVKVHLAEPANQRDLDAFAGKTGFHLPSSFSDFFSNFSNGYTFCWESEDGSGVFSMPDLEALAAMQRDWVENICKFADDPESMNLCVEPEFREEAFRIWARMKNWIPFFEEPDGDAFCIDLTTGAIVFNKHDWFDGFGEIAETNGMIAGSSLIDFIRTWGRFCFSSMWFGDAPHPAGQTYLEWLE